MLADTGRAPPDDCAPSRLLCDRGTALSTAPLSFAGSHRPALASRISRLRGYTRSLELRAFHGRFQGRLFGFGDVALLRFAWPAPPSPVRGRGRSPARALGDWTVTGIPLIWGMLSEDFNRDTLFPCGERLVGGRQKPIRCWRWRSRKLGLWLASINPNRVSEESRPQGRALPN